MMSEYFIYLLKTSVFTAAIYSFYWIALRNTTFHQLNRVFLLSGLLISFVLPFVHFQTEIPFPSPNLEVMLRGLDEPGWFFEGTEQATSSQKSQYLDWGHVLLYAYIFIAFILLFRSLKGIKYIVRIKKKASIYSVTGIDYFSGPEVNLPFSFFNWIFYPSEDNTNSSGIEILKHEKVHAEQWHTLDLLIVEFITIVLWFNPFVFLFRQSLKQVHEYLADSKAIETPEAKAEYLRLLVSNAQKSVLTGLASQFYWLKLKKRITMITKNRTTKLYRLSYILIVPIIALTTMAFGSIDFTSPEPINKTGNMPNIAPIKQGQYEIASRYGMHTHPIYKVDKMHFGIDLKAPMGAPVMATADGMVVRVEFKEEGKGYGRNIVIQHDGTYSTLYTQLSEFKVQAGDKVKQGDIIGLVGSSGISTGPHLHYEVWKKEKKVNPEDYFK